MGGKSCASLISFLRGGGGIVYTSIPVTGWAALGEAGARPAEEKRVFSGKEYTLYSMGEASLFH